MHIGCKHVQPCLVLPATWTDGYVASSDTHTHIYIYQVDVANSMWSRRQARPRVSVVAMLKRRDIVKMRCCHGDTMTTSRGVSLWHHNVGLLGIMWPSLLKSHGLHCVMVNTVKQNPNLGFGMISLISCHITPKTSRSDWMMQSYVLAKICMSESGSWQCRNLLEKSFSITVTLWIRCNAKIKFSESLQEFSAQKPGLFLREN